MASKPTIYPELIKPGDWQVGEWRPDGSGAPCPCTDNAGRRMFVPAGNGPWAREVRFHELLHVRYSPQGVPDDTGATMQSLLASEDCRVNLKGARIRSHDALAHGPKPDPLMAAMKMSERDMARLTVASIGYESSDDWMGEFSSQLAEVGRNPSLPEWLREHAKMLRRALRLAGEHWGDFVDEDADFDAAIDLAKWIDETFSDATPGPKQANPDPEKGEYDEAPAEGGDASGAKWGEMKIETPPLTVMHPNAVGRRTTPCKEGARIGHWNRLATGEIFGRTRKRATPDAVLIDQSGSMSWNASKLHELVKRMPVGIVAGYDGCDGRGVLRVLAKDGRMVAPDAIEPAYGGNEVDGPALRWLAKQPGRKVWVSDQGVCSDVCDDEEALMADCKAVMAKAGIRVCLTTDPARIMRALRGR